MKGFLHMSSSSTVSSFFSSIQFLSPAGTHERGKEHLVLCSFVFIIAELFFMTLTSFIPKLSVRRHLCPSGNCHLLLLLFEELAESRRKLLSTLCGKLKGLCYSVLLVMVGLGHRGQRGRGSSSSFLVGHAGASLGDVVKIRIFDRLHL